MQSLKKRLAGAGGAWYAGGRMWMPPGDGEVTRKDGGALMSVAVADDIYKGSHRVGIYTCPRIIGGTVNAKRK